MDSAEISLMIIILFILACGGYLYYERIYKPSLNETRAKELDLLINPQKNNQENGLDKNYLQHIGWLKSEKDTSGFSNMILYFYKLDGTFKATPSYDPSGEIIISLSEGFVRDGDEVNINNSAYIVEIKKEN